MYEFTHFDKRHAVGADGIVYVRAQDPTGAEYWDRIDRIEFPSSAESLRDSFTRSLPSSGKALEGEGAGGAAREGGRRPAPDSTSTG